ncbi:unnamed protein product [Calypogeia fissa]
MEEGETQVKQVQSQQARNHEGGYFTSTAVKTGVVFLFGGKRYDSSDSSSLEEGSSSFESQEDDPSSSNFDSSSSEEEEKKRRKKEAAKKKKKKKKKSSNWSRGGKTTLAKPKVEVAVAMRGKHLDSKVEELSM